MNLSLRQTTLVPYTGKISLLIWTGCYVVVIRKISGIMMVAGQLSRSVVPLYCSSTFCLCKDLKVYSCKVCCCVWYNS